MGSWGAAGRLVGVVVPVVMVVAGLVVANFEATAASGEVGEVVTVAGDGLAHDVEGVGLGAGLDAPAAVAVAGSGVLVHTRAAVMRFHPASGAVSRLAGGSWVGCQDSAPGVEARLAGADDVAVRGAGLLVASRSCGAVREVSLATGAVSTLAKVHNVRGVAVGPEGGVFVSHGSAVSRLVVDPDAGPGDPPYKTQPFAVFEHGELFAYPLPMVMSSDEDALWVAVGSSLSSAAVRLARVDWDTRVVSVLGVDAALRAEGLASAGDGLFAATATAVRRYDKADGSWGLVAGTSAPGFADGLGVEAWFGSVSGVAGDGSVLWVADRSNNRLRRVTPGELPPPEQAAEAPVIEAGEVSTLATGFDAPSAVAVAGGRVYVAGRGAVGRVEPDGSVTVVAGQVSAYGNVDDPDPQAARFSADIRQLTSDGHFLYAADYGNGRVRRVSLATGATSTVTAISQPAGVVLRDATLYVSRAAWVYAVDAVSGHSELLATVPTSYAVGGAVTADEESVWVALGRMGMYFTQLVRIDRTSGAVSVVAADAGLESRALASAGGYVYTASANALRRYDKSDGSWAAVAGTSGAGLADGVGEDAWFSSVGGVAASAEVLYAADTGNGRVRAVSAGWAVGPVDAAQGPEIVRGEVGTVARGDGAGGGGLYRPGAVTVTGGAAYVAVPGAVQRVLANGSVTTLAGRPGSHGMVDSATADDVRFSGRVPQITTDGVFLYAADRDNSRIRRVSLATGATSTVVSLSGIRGVLYRDGWLYVSQGAAVRRVDPRTGAFETFAAFQHGSEFSYPQAAALSADDEALWVAVDSLSSLAALRLARVEWDSAAVSVLALGNGLAHTAVLSAGDWLYAATPTGIYRFDKQDGSSAMPAGTPATAGDADGLGDDARFAWIHGLATDGEALYVTDFSNDALRLVYDYEFAREPGDLVGRSWYAAFVADPVNAATGSFVETETDLGFPPAAAALTLERTYNSRGAAGLSGARDAGWSWSHGQRVETGAGGLVRWRRGDGRVVAFEPDGAGGYSRPLELRGDLVALPQGGWQLVFDDGSRSAFDAGGRLAGRVQPDGVEVAYGYDGGVLTSATASSGYHVAFGYDGEGRLVSVEAGDGREVAYGYGSDGCLVSVTLPDGSTRGYVCDERGRIAEITDGAGRLVVANSYDAFGRVVEQQTPAGNTIRFDYDPGERVTSVTDVAAGSTTRYAHDEAARLVGVEDATGASLERAYSAGGFVNSAVDRAGGVASQVVDGRGNVTSRTHADEAVESWTYDALDRVTSHTDATGATTTFAYDGHERQPVSIVHPDGGQTVQTVAGGLVTSRTDPDGVHATFAYDPQRNLVTATDGAGATTTLSYDDAGRLVTRTSPLGHTILYAWDAAGRLVSETEPTGATTAYTYDAAGNLTSQTDPSGATTTYTYDAAGLLVAVVDPLGAVTAYAYDALAQLEAVTRPGGATTTYTWGPLGRLASVIDPAGGATGYGYDIEGNVTATTDGADATTVTGYDPRGRVTSVTDPLGATTTFAYDAAGRLTSETDPTGATTTHAYDAAGRRVETVDATGAVTAYRWTPGGRLAQVEDALGGVTAHAYDAAGRRVSTTDALGGVTVHGYDLDGRLTSVTSPAGLVTAYACDPAGRLVAETHPAGGVTTTTYTPRGEVESVTDAAGGVRTFAYDAAGRLVAVTDANGATTHMAYDGRGNRVARTDALGGVEGWSFDAADRVVSYNDRLGRVTEWGYDDAGRLAQVSDPSGRSQAYTYDPAGRLVETAFGDASTVTRAYDAAGRLTSVTDPSGQVAYAWDGAGRLTGYTAADGASWSYGWDAVGRLAAVTGPDGREIAYGHDPAGRLTSITTPGVGAVAYAYDADGRLTGEALPGGGSRAWTWTGGRLTGFAQQVDELTTSSSLAYDVAGRLVEATVDGVTTAYAYDAAGQLVGAATAGGSNRTYMYDPLGRRVSSTVDGYTGVYGYDATGQLVAITGPEGATTLAYDLAGRRLAESGPGRDVAYTYDTRGRLTAVTVDDGASVTVAEREWDATDRLTSLAASVDGGPATVTGLWWDPLPVVPQVARIQQGGAETLDLVYGHGRVYALDPAGTPAVIATDHLGSQTATTATAGLTAAAGYSPFGQPDGPPDPATVAFGYRGELHTGDLVHLRHRDYQPATGAFLTPDPLDGVVGYPTVVNGYHYAHNNPLGLVDPLGLRPWSDADARCWMLHGTCTEVLGDIDQASRGVIDTFGEMLAGLWHVARDPASVAEAFEQTYRDAGGGWRGRYEAANLLNPVYHVLVSGDACLQANHGNIDVRAAAAACTEFTVTAAGTAAGTAATARATTTLAARRSLAPRAADAGTDLVRASQRTRLLHNVNDPRLRDVVEQLYRPNARSGSGSAMDAFRFEQQTGQLLSRTGHGTKLLERRTQLHHMLPELSGTDRAIARELLIDIQNALSGY